MKNDEDKQKLIEKLQNKLMLANKELAFQNEEKEKREAELVLANKDLVFRDNEKEKREAELVLANKDLVFRDNEKENRVAKLNIANKEIDSQAEIIRLQESYYIDRQLFEATLVSIGDAVISCDNDCNIVFANTVAEILSGWSLDEIKGKPID